MIISRRKRELRDSIRKCNGYKAALFANRDSYEKGYYESKLREYDRFIKSKERELVEAGRRSRRILHYSIAVLVFLIIIFGLFHFKPSFVGFSILEYSNEEAGALSNITLISQNPDYVNEEGLQNISATPTQAPSNITPITFFGNVTSENASEGAEISATPKTPHGISPVYINEELAGNASLNISVNESALNASTTNITANATLPELNVSATNITAENMSVGNASINVTKTEPNISVQNVSVKNVSVQANATVPVENATLEFDNLPPSGSVPMLQMEPNMVLTLALDSYFTDTGPLSYSVDENDHLDVSVDGSVLNIISGNETGNFTVLLYVSDGFNLVASAVNVDVAFIAVSLPVNVTANATAIHNMTNETAVQGSAEIGVPVKWTRVIKKKPNETIRLNIQALDGTIKIKDKSEKDIKFKTVKGQAKKQAKTLSENTTIEIDTDETYVQVEYYTEGPVASERNISSTRKDITISSDIHYTDILAHTTLPREAEPDKVRLYHVVNGSRSRVNITEIDTDNDSLIDYIRWIVPHLSNQTYELIIEISKAEHLDSDRDYISDIYDDVKDLDGNWSEPIDDGEYVRVTFEQNLTSGKDITVFARSVNGSSSIEVYKEYSDEPIAAFQYVLEKNWYKVYLTNMVGSTDVFDLRVVGNPVEFDYIVDPVQTLSFRENGAAVNTTDDSFLSSGSPGSNYGTTAGLSVDGSPLDRTVIKFPNIFGDGDGQIPLGSTITSATLTLYNDNDVGNNPVIYILRENWTESEVTWNSRETGVSWTDAGAYGFTSCDTAISASTTLGTANSYDAIDVTDFVQDWSDGAGNYGFLIHPGGTSGITISSSEDSTAARRPKLSVTFFPPTTNFITLNSPANASTVKVAYPMLNATVNNDGSSNMTAYLYGYYDDSADNISKDGLVGYWRLDNISSAGEDDTTIHDWSGNGNDGVCYGTCPVWTPSCKFNGCYNFTDSEGIFRIPPDSSMDNLFDGGGTVSAWIYLKGWSTDSMYIVSSRSGGSGYWHFWFAEQGGEYRLDLTVNGDYPDDGLWAIDLDEGSFVNTWHHVAVVFDDTSIANEPSFYIDGVLQTVFAENQKPDALYYADVSDPLYIGGRQPEYDRTLNGTIDEVMLYNRSLSPAEIRQLYHKGFYKLLYLGSGLSNNTEINYNLTSLPLSPDDGMVMLLHFDNDSSVGESDTNVFDWTWNGNNGTCIGSSCPSFNISGGKFGGAYDYDGVNDYINFSNDASLDIRGDITIAAWVKRKPMTKNFGVIEKRTPSQSTYAYSIQNDGNQEFWFTEGVGNWYGHEQDSGATLPEDEWHMVSMTYDKSYIRFYIDGAETDNLSETHTPDSLPSVSLLIGDHYSSGSVYSNGSIDEVAIWNRSLSAAEVQALYELGNGRYYWKGNVSDGTSSAESDTWWFELNISDTTPPAISFVKPTPPNATITTNTSVIVNVSINESNLDEFIWNWNGTNYTVMDDSLVLMMNFDNVSSLGENDTHVVDVSGNGNDGTAQSGAKPTNYAKFGSGSYNFSGSGTCAVQVADDPSIRLQNMTIAAWVKTSAIDNQIIVTKRYSAVLSPYNSYIFDIKHNKYRFNLADATNYTERITSTTNTSNTWVYVAGTFDGTTMELYVNGNLENSSDGFSGKTILHSSLPLSIGDYGDNWEFSGQIDELRIYNRTLSASEVQELYMSSLRKYDTDKWSFYINQTKNATAGLDNGTYTYQAYAADSDGNRNETEQRWITIGVGENAPNITLIYPPNASTINESYIILNASVSDADNDSMSARLYGYYADEIDPSEETGLVLLMHFNNDSSIGENDTHIVDSSGGGYDGNCSGTYCPQFVDYGRFGGAFDFDGINDKFNLSSDASLDDIFVNGGTVSAWLTIGSWGGVNNLTYVVSKFNSGNGGWIFWVKNEGWEPNALVFTKLQTSIGFWSCNDTIYPGNTYHVAVVYDQGNIANDPIMYVDGKRCKLGTQDHPDAITSDASQDVFIGGRGTTSNRNYNGTIDEVAIWDRPLSDEEIYSLYDKGRYKLLYSGENLSDGEEINYNLTSMPLSVQKGMVLLMHFDNDSSVGEDDTHVYDWTGNGNNATCSDCPVFNISGGKFGGAFDFDGSEDYFALPDNNPIWLPSGDFTIGSWVKIDNISGEHYIFDGNIRHSSTPSNRMGYCLDSNSGCINFSLIISDTPYYISSCGISEGEWYYVTAIREGTSQKIYIDGALKSTKTIPSSNIDWAGVGDDKVNIGRLSQPGLISYYFDGIIDEVAIWNRSLNASEVAALYELQSGRYYWKGNVSDGSSSAESDVWWFELGESAGLNITLNSPENASTVNTSTVILNATVSSGGDANLYGYYADEIEASEETGLVLLMHFNNDSSVGEDDSTVYDWTGNGGDGTCSGLSCPLVEVSGIFKSSRAFDGDDDFIELNSVPVGNSDAFTVAHWFRTTYSSRERTYDERKTTNSETMVTISVNEDIPGDVAFYITDDSATLAGMQTKGMGLNDGKWHFVAAVQINKSLRKLYVDGNLIKNFQFEVNSTIGTLTPDILGIGKNFYADSAYFNGSVDELAVYSRALSAQEVKRLYDKGRYKLLYSGSGISDGTEIDYNLTSMPLSVQKGMVLLMHFDNDSSVGENDTNVYDWTGMGNNGTVVDGNATFNISGGKFGGAYDFDGSGDFIDVQDDNSLNFGTSDFSISFWMKTSYDMPIVSENIILRKDDVGGSPRRFYQVVHGQTGGADEVYFLVHDGGLTDSATYQSPKVHDGQWHQVVAVRNSSDVSIYFDGFLADSEPNNNRNVDNDGNLKIATRDELGRYFNGSLDEVAIWNRSLSASEIQSIYELGNGRYYWKGNVTDRVSSAESDMWWFDINYNAPTYISFVRPTPQNSATTSNTSVKINVSINVTGLNEFRWSWDGTNYTLLNDSLVLMYNFDNVSALGECTILNQAGCIKDLSSYGNDGKLGSVAGTDPTWTSSGRYGGAFTFDGSNDFIDATSNSSLDDLTEITVIAWIYPTSVGEGGFGRIYSKENNTAGSGMDFDTMNASSPQLVIRQMYTDSPYENLFKTQPDSIKLNTWQQVALVYDSSSVNNNPVFYINGIAQTTIVWERVTGSRVSDAGNHVFIGSDPGRWRVFNGSIDEVRVYNRLLSAGEIQELYMSNLNKYGTGKWSFFINQSKSPVEGLDSGTYAYQAFAADFIDNWYQTEQRYIDIMGGFEIALNSPENASSVDAMSVLLNATVSDSANSSNIARLYGRYTDEIDPTEEDGLVMLMHFDNDSSEDENGTFIYDWSGNGHDGEIAPVSIYVNQSSDDAEENLGTGETGITSSDLELISDGATLQEVGMRFQGVDIPQGAKITDAHIEFTVDEADSGATSIIFWGDDTDNAATFSTVGSPDYDITGRTKTTESVDWDNIPAWDTIGSKQGSPDISPITQEIVDREGWSSGNSLAIIINGTGHRTAVSYNGDPSNAPRLVVNYEKYASGKFDKSIDFDGMDDYVNISGGCMLGQTFSVSFWVYPESPASWSRIFLQGNLSCPTWQAMALWRTDHIEVVADNAGDSTYTQVRTGSIPQYKWSYFVWNYDNGKQTLYVNGQMSNSTASGANVGVVGQNFLGIRLVNGVPGNFFKGRLDEFALWNRPLSSQEILSFYDRGRDKLLYSGSGLTDGEEIDYNLTAMPLSVQKDMVLLMHFDNDSSVGESDTHVYDWSGNGNNGTVMCNGTCTLPAWNISGGKFGGTYEFDGIDDFIRTAADNPFDDLNTGTLSAWIKTGSSSGVDIASYSTTESITSLMEWYIGDGHITQVWKSPPSGSWPLVEANFYVADNKWHFIVFTADGTNRVKIYADGNELSTSFNASGGTGSDSDFIADILNVGSFNNFFEIGAFHRQGEGWGYFNGTIDEVAIWNRSLSASEVKNLYQLQNGRYYWKGNITDGTNSEESDVWQFDKEPLYALRITDPTTSAPVRVSGGDNMTVTFNFTEDGDNVTSGVEIGDVYVGGVLASPLLYYGVNGSEDIQIPVSCSGYDYSSQIEAYSQWTIPGSGTVNVSRFYFYQSVSNFGPTESLPIRFYTSGGAAISGSDNTVHGTGRVGWTYVDYSAPFELTLGSTYYVGMASPGGLTIARDRDSDCPDYLPNTGSYIVFPGDITPDNTVPTGSSSGHHYGIFGIAYDTYGDRTVTSFNAGVGWQTNVTVPDFSYGYRDLLVNATYGGSYTSGMQAGAVYYGTPPNITLNRPPNASTVNESSVVLNATVHDADDDNLTARLYGYYSDEINASDETGLVGLWHFDNDSSVGENDTFIYDWSGNGNSGTCSVNTCPNLTAYGRFKASYEFDGEDNFTLPIDAIAGLQEFSISAWVNLADLDSDHVILGQFNDEGVNESLLWYDLGGWVSGRDEIFSFHSRDINSNQIRIEGANHSAMADEWIHIAITMISGKADGLRLYINGKEDPNSPTSTAAYLGLPVSSNDLMIGMANNGHGFTGSIDEVAIYNRSLSAQEVKRLNDKGRYKLLYSGEDLTDGEEINYNLTSMPLSVQDGMVLLMHFDNDSSVGESDTNVYDWTGMGNNGTCSGGTCPSFNISSGQFGGAFEFDGSDDFIDIDSVGESLQGTLAAWVYINDNTGQKAIFSFSSTNTISPCFPSSLVFEINSGKLRGHLIRCTTNHWILDTDSDMPTNEWVHVALTQDAVEPKLYVNGVFVNQTFSNEFDKTEWLDEISAWIDSKDIGRYNDNSPEDFFNGSIDEVAIWNRSLSATEIQEIYQLQSGRYYWKGNVSDGSSSAESDVWWFELNYSETNTAPIINQTNITPTTAYFNSTFNCSSKPIDNESSNINVSFTWWVNGSNINTWDTTVSCTNNTWCFTDDYPSGFLKHYNITCSARAFDGSLYSYWKNSSTVELSNYGPDNVSLIWPEHGNNTLLNRRPNFNFTNTTDPEDDSLLFEIFIQRMTCSSPLSCDVKNLTANTTDTNYTPSIDLDIDSWYNWSVRVYDGEQWSSYSETWNFSILSTSMITLSGTVNFGQLSLNDINDTTDDSPPPFLIENDGNVRLNISIYAQDALWDSEPLDTQYFTFKADNSTETNACAWPLSQVSWAHVDGTTIAQARLAVAYLNFTGNDSVEIDIGIKVPPNEPKGAKSSTIVMEAGYSG